MSFKDVKWYVQPDDLVGGWCITVEPKKPSTGVPVVADVTRKADAEHIVNLHNNWLELQKKPKFHIHINEPPPQPPFRIPIIPPRMY